MPLHLVKLCVGAGSADDLRAWVEARVAERHGRGEEPVHVHTTRMTPKRVAELLEGGSLFWVIRGEITIRQPLRDIRPFTDPHGIGRCDLVLDPALVPVDPRPRRPFQGWRYLVADEAPPDMSAAADGSVLPEPMRRTLREMGLL